ncbi:hypothetical protein AB6A40_007825 [Gnathostoma spinigerum]|uniref:GP-PDE domain-containing protein n=1 Tax=Gnathostoma spinigerum TaxID=75299 RepID=A0ABD6EUJ5_9BILA
MVNVWFLGIYGVLFVIYTMLPSSVRAYFFVPLAAAFGYIILWLCAEKFGHKQGSEADRQTFFDGFRIGGHRGAPKVAPENTIASFKEAVDSKVDLVEFDLALTKDNVVVLMHDDDTSRTCGEPGLISSLTYDEIKKRNAGRTFCAERKIDEVMYPIPTLIEVVDFCQKNNIKMLFDVKDSSHEMVQQIASIISSRNLYSQAIISSFFPHIPYAVKRLDNRILTGYTWRPYFFSYADLHSTVPRFSGIKQILASLLDRINMALIHSEVLLHFLGVEMLLTEEKSIDGELVQQMNRRNIQVVAWTVNDAKQIMYFLDALKVPVLTDHPALLKKVAIVRNSLTDAA